MFFTSDALCFTLTVFHWAVHLKTTSELEVKAYKFHANCCFMSEQKDLFWNQLVPWASKFQFLLAFAKILLVKYGDQHGDAWIHAFNSLLCSSYSLKFRLEMIFYQTDVFTQTQTQRTKISIFAWPRPKFTPG